jgi:hypothetical protein
MIHFPGIEKYNGYACGRNYKAAIKTALAAAIHLRIIIKIRIYYYI